MVLHGYGFSVYLYFTFRFDWVPKVNQIFESSIFQHFTFIYDREFDAQFMQVFSEHPHCAYLAHTVSLEVKLLAELSVYQLFITDLTYQKLWHFQEDFSAPYYFSHF